jgi:hypothetical protein
MTMTITIMNYHNNYVYLLIEREFIKTGENVYKIGLTKQKELMRFSQYPKGSDLLLHSMCNNCRDTEKEIIKQFKEHFIQRNDFGNEYFEGDCNHMVYLIHTIIANEYKNEFTKNDNVVVNDNKINNNDVIFNNNEIVIIQEHDDTYICVPCNYKTGRKDNYNRHIQSVRHLDKISEKEKNYTCSLCNFKCNKKTNYNIHLTSNKHIQNVKVNSETNKNIIMSSSSNIEEVFKNELIVSTIMSQLNTILEENNKNILAEQTKLMVETQTKLMKEMASNKGPSNVNNNNTINNNQTNNQFNLNMFLNETCKDAMNLSEFLENMHVSMEDMEKTGELGFAKGMSRIIMNNLNAIDVCKRPIHCSDVKRETLYVKNNGVWEKETEDRKRTKEIIYKASRLNLKELLKWRDLPRNKGYDKSDHSKNDEFTNLVMEINKMREEEFDKIITSVSKHVAIDKEKVKMSGYLN